MDTSGIINTKLFKYTSKVAKKQTESSKFHQNFIKHVFSFSIILPTICYSQPSNSFKSNLAPTTTYDQQFYSSIDPIATDLYLNSFTQTHTSSPTTSQNRVSIQSYCEKSRMHDKTGTSKIIRLDFTGKDQLLHRTEELISSRQTKRFVVKYEQFEFMVKVSGKKRSQNIKKLVKILWNENLLKKRDSGYKKRYANRIESKVWVECGKNPVVVVKREENYLEC